MKKRRKKKVAKTFMPVLPRNKEGLTFEEWYRRKYPGKKF